MCLFYKVDLTIPYHAPERLSWLLVCTNRTNEVLYGTLSPSTGGPLRTAPLTAPFSAEARASAQGPADIYPTVRDIIIKRAKIISPIAYSVTPYL